MPRPKGTLFSQPQKRYHFVLNSIWHSEHRKYGPCAPRPYFLSRPVWGHAHIHSTSPFSSPSLTSSLIRLFSSVDHGKLISICFAVISRPWLYSRGGASLLGCVCPRRQLLLSCQPAPARGPWHPASPRFSKGFSPIGDVETLGSATVKVFPRRSAACCVLNPPLESSVWAVLFKCMFCWEWMLFAVTLRAFHKTHSGAASVMEPL